VICPICATRRVSFISDHLDFPAAGIYLCGDCQHWFVHPEPEQAWLDDYYKTVYGPQRRRWFGREYEALMQRRAKAQVSFVRRVLRTESVGTNGLTGWRILDPGCGIGALVAAFELEGARAAGYDSDPVAIEKSRNLWQAHVYSTLDEALGYTDGPLDLMCMSHVLEHVPDIKASVLNMMSIIKPKGYLFVEVPNSFPQMFEAGIDHESHLHFFTPESLVSLFRSLNARVLVCQSCGPPKHSGYGLQAPRAETSIYDSVVPVLVRLAYLGGRIREATGGVAPIQTVYDGYYSRYYRPHDSRGMWLRCLVQMPDAR
jgi:2-polyprenyl-3-methyl-5-hydroxy-6-metoxy-1,4-benzoquinol methylase